MFRSLEVAGNAKAMLDTVESWTSPVLAVAYAAREARRSLGWWLALALQVRHWDQLQEVSQLQYA